MSVMKVADHQEAKQGKVHREMLRERRKGHLESDGEAGADGFAAVGAGEGAARLSVSQCTQLNWSRVKLLRYQLMPAVSGPAAPRQQVV